MHVIQREIKINGKLIGRKIGKSKQLAEQWKIITKNIYLKEHSISN